ncbi:CBO0543 family protein [Metabacillus litoralis]|uniref:CBO0543 family protein n=1 Tax=Metabacillus litoralis TaxID=152268 RepID=UPI001CFE361B|nr:CBO0543 family protein [Metabacillus litoralis]
MHTLTHLACIFFVYKFANLREWKNYHPTLLYICVINLLYNFLLANYDLWKYQPDFYSNHSLTEVGNSIILLPAIAYIFLTYYPENQGMRKILKYYLKWIVWSLVIESVYVYFGKITFHHGYKFWMEPFFYILMYTFVRLHYKKPLLTYFLSVIVVLLLLWIFDIPVTTPINQRH